MILKVPTAVIFLMILLSRYFEYVKGINLNTYLILGLVSVLVISGINLKRSILCVLLVYSLLFYDSSKVKPPQNISLTKELYGVAHIESLVASPLPETKSKAYCGKFIKLNLTNKSLENKRIIFVSDVHTNFKKNCYYNILGTIGLCKYKQAFIVNLINYKEIYLSNKISDVFFYKIKINRSNRAFLKAFLFGDKSELSSEQKVSFRNSGTMHLFAVSGLHVGCLFFAINFLFRSINFSQKSNILVTMILLYGYLYLVDFSVSSTRAYIMLFIWSLTRLIGIKINSYSLVCTTGVILLLLNSENIVSIGFILSISVVFSILWFMENTNFIKKSLLKRKVFQICLVNYAAFCGSFIVLGKVFGIIIPISLLSNLILIPVVSILMPLAFIGLFLLQFSCLSFLIPFFEWPLYLVNDLCTWLSGFSWSTISLDSNYTHFDYYLYYMIIFFVVSFGTIKKMIIKLLIVPLVLWLLLKLV